jgi:hypothetical protein
LSLSSIFDVELITIFDASSAGNLLQNMETATFPIGMSALKDWLERKKVLCVQIQAICMPIQQA